MDNGTNSSGWQNLPLYLIYMTEGSVVSIGNIFIALTILRFEALRSNKEYSMMLGLAIADSINQIGYFLAGLYRAIRLVNGTYSSYRTVWECMTTLHGVFWSVSPTLAASMLVVVSTDRLLCVMFPLAYLGWTTSYSRSFIGVVYLINIATAVYSFISAYGLQSLMPGVCVTELAIQKSTHLVYSLYYSRMPQIYACVSVLIYVIVLVFYKKSINIVDATQHPNNKYELKRQRKVIVTLAISAVCTFVVFVIPYSIATNLFELSYYKLAVGFWCVANLNAFCNVFIYPLRHKEMRQAIKAMLQCKHMPVDLKLWNVQPNVAK